MGALARNHAGEVLAAMACKGQGAVDAEVAEACSLRRALYLGLILLDCKALLASFESCRVQHVRRLGNAAAHELARRAVSAEADEFWVDAIPATMSIVTGDMHHI
ncbi:hypothetical protein SLEP1_g48001 [Rubroshorea leprosula]|uniref:RNase H type-1 domain-containing protein n=1 Tax=Rubroshorea leprosula TaxID=152421 RepID=A0AAV5LU33_9ROSI|nr:hypothetical protein SLEP1_g48001 [Rubroshorea leprosula]